MTAPRCTRAIADECDDVDVQPVLLYLRRVPRPICRRCRTVLETRGIDFTVVESAPIEHRPAWLDHLTARDETGRVVVA